MTKAESVSIVTAMRAAFPDAAVTVSVRVNDNQDVTALGVRDNTTTARVLGKAALSNQSDVSVWCVATALGLYSPLTGRVATLTDSAGAKTTWRVLAEQMHALGGVVNLVLGEGDRVIA